MNLNAEVYLLNNVSFQDKLLFTRHLGVMLRSGIPLAEAITEIIDQTKNGYFKKILKNISDDVSDGKKLEFALRRYPKIFDPFYTSLVKIGEESGTLENTLEFLSEHLKKDYQFRQKIVAASMYPSIVFVTVAVVGMGVSLFVLPKMIELFSTLDVELPWMTRILLWVAKLMKDYGVLIFAGLFLLILLLRLSLNIKQIKYRWQAFLLSLPYLGEFIQSTELAIFCRNLGVMLKSGLTISSALENQLAATSNLVYKSYVKEMLTMVDRGEELGQSLVSKKFKFVPKIAGKMIGVGEKSGRLEESFVYLGDYFTDEVDNTMKNLASVAEPILLLFIGLVVGFVAIAIISPIYQFTGSITR